MLTTESTPFSDLLSLLNYGPDEQTAVCWRVAGTSTLRFAHTTTDGADAIIADHLDAADVWFAVNPLTPPSRGRGTEQDVARVAALFVDIDLKANGGVADVASAESLAIDLAVALGEYPVAVVSTGNGAHVYWSTDPEDPAWTLDTDDKRAAAASVYRRFHRLAADIAEAHGGAVDNVNDLPRILRVPGTSNRKNPDDPLMVTLHTEHPWGGGAAMSYTQVTEALTEYGVPETDNDREVLGPVVSDAAEWTFGDETNPYVAAMIDGWRADLPDARHPWLASQCVRLAAAVRLGRITRDDYDDAVTVLRDRFEWLCGNHGDKRAVGKGEVAGCLSFGVEHVERMDDERTADEIGGEDLTDPVALPDPTTTSDANDPDSDMTMPGQARFTDAGLAEIITTKALLGKFAKARGIGWLQWTGTHWRECGDGAPTEAVRRFVMNRMRFFARKLAADPANGDLLDAIDAWKKVATAARITAVLKLAGNLVEVDGDALDADLDLLNTPNGVVNLRTGDVSAHDPALLMTRITKGPTGPDTTTPTSTRPSRRCRTTSAIGSSAASGRGSPATCPPTSCCSRVVVATASRHSRPAD